MQNNKSSEYSNSTEIRWCPGCGDYAILKAVKDSLAKLNISKENIVFISGIGCSGRFPYYINTYGFHTIHGRAAAIATGLKLTRPDLSVWVITGDGDGLSIGANHLLHLLRRNIDINILLINNQIYGLTKGQISPTSSQSGAKKIAVQSNSDIRAVNPTQFALAAGGTYIARCLAVDIKNLESILMSAYQHKGTAFIEIYQNCHIYNDGAFANYENRKSRQESTVWLEHGKPIQFGCDNSKKIIKNGWDFSIAQPDNVKADEVITHNVTNKQMAFALTEFEYKGFPKPFGIFYCEKS